MGITMNTEVRAIDILDPYVDDTHNQLARIDWTASHLVTPGRREFCRVDHRVHSIQVDCPCYDDNGNHLGTFELKLKRTSHDWIDTEGHTWALISNAPTKTLRKPAAIQVDPGTRTLELKWT